MSRMKSGIMTVPHKIEPPTIDDIGWSLARIPRFNGHTERWYSVLSHTLCVASVTSVIEQSCKLGSHDLPAYYSAGRGGHLLKTGTVLAALLHDAPEAVVGDRSTTWKSDADRKIEDRLFDSIWESVNAAVLSPLDINLSMVKAADLACLWAEAQLLGVARVSDFDFVLEDVGFEVCQVALHRTGIQLGQVVDDPTNNDECLCRATRYKSLVMEIVRGFGGNP